MIHIKNLKIGTFDGSTSQTWLSGDSSSNLTAGGNITLANDKKVIFGDAAEFICGNGTDLSIKSSNKIVLDADGGATDQIADTRTQLIKFFKFDLLVA